MKNENYLYPFDPTNIIQNNKEVKYLVLNLGNTVANPVPPENFGVKTSCRYFQNKVVFL